jgi:diacylglycerol kinase family enzyme
MLTSKHFNFFFSIFYITSIIFYYYSNKKNQFQSKIFSHKKLQISFYFKSCQLHFILKKQMFTKHGLTFGVFGRTNKYYSQWIMRISLLVRIAKQNH